jgi:hypothetical protein
LRSRDAQPVKRPVILAVLALAAAVFVAVSFQGPALCLPPICHLPVSPSWPFNPAGLSGVRIAAVFVAFFLMAVLLAVALRRWTRWPTLLIGVPVAILLSVLVVDGASPIGRWYAADGTPLNPDGHPLVLSVELGSGHCGWQHVAFLALAWPPDRPVPGGFMSDPRTKSYVWQTTSAYPPSSLATTPGVVARLPADAEDTGLHRGTWKLWVSPAQLTTGVFLTSGDTIEHWAFISRFVGCA